MKVALALLAAHAGAVVFGLAGILVALRHPELWSGSTAATWVFSFGMRHGGFVQIALGAAAVFAYGVVALGWRRTGIFFAVSTTLSLACELVGTSTGWPFGNYEYTAGLGPKVLERVPVAIPLSWFSVGLAAYLLACIALAGRERHAGGWRSVALGAWLLTVWDLVLDPAMAHGDMPLRFWIWHEGGSYYGMPLQNFAGWALTGVLFMGLGRLLWGAGPDASRLSPGFPLAVYVLNLAFAVALDASVGLWGPIALAVVLGLLPALLAWRSAPLPDLLPETP